MLHLFISSLSTTQKEREFEKTTYLLGVKIGQKRVLLSDLCFQILKLNRFEDSEHERLYFFISQRLGIF